MQKREKVEALTKDINELKSKNTMIKKPQETLKSDPESLMLKAAEDATNLMHMIWKQKASCMSTTIRLKR